MDNSLGKRRIQMRQEQMQQLQQQQLQKNISCQIGHDVTVDKKAPSIDSWQALAKSQAKMQMGDL